MPDKKINPLDFKDDIAIGVGLPFNSTNGFKLNYVTEDQIHANLKNLVLTMRGERVMHPTFGSGLYELLFEPNVSDTLNSLLIETITESVNEWMPFVTIKDINARVDSNTAFILISYEVKELDISKILDITVRIY